MNNLTKAFLQTVEQSGDLKKLKEKERIDYLKKRFDELTIELKEMDGSHPRFSRTWDVRADLKRELEIMEMEFNK